MKSLKKIAVLVLVFGLNNIFGQEVKISESSQESYIEVSATTEMEFYPDEIFLGIIIAEKTENKVKVKLEDQEKLFFNILKNLGIGIENLKFSDPNALFADINMTKNEVFLKREFVLKLSDVSIVSQLFFELQKQGFTDVGIIKVGHSKEDSLFSEVKILTVRKAKDKANLYLAAIDKKLGDPIEIKETEDVYSDARKSVRYSSRSYDSKNYGDGKKILSTDGNEIKLPKLMMKSTVNVKFSIQKK
jgi:uncharacterized protein YggE